MPKSAPAFLYPPVAVQSLTPLHETSFKKASISAGPTSAGTGASTAVHWPPE